MCKALHRFVLLVLELEILLFLPLSGCPCFYGATVVIYRPQSDKLLMFLLQLPPPKPNPILVAFGNVSVSGAGLSVGPASPSSSPAPIEAIIKLNL